MHQMEIQSLRTKVRYKLLTEGFEFRARLAHCQINVTRWERFGNNEQY